MSKTIQQAIVVATFSGLLVGCAQPKTPLAPQPVQPSFQSGEQMLMESQRLQQLGQRWTEGKQKVKRGEEIVREGESKIEEGKAMIREGERIMNESQEGSKGLK